ncbi:Gamma-glutamyltranspeptidase 1 [Mactra antiquata]
MSTEDRNETDTIPPKEDLLFGGAVRPKEENNGGGGCCTCTKKKLIIIAVIVIMLLLYGIGLAIGLAIGMTKDKQSEDGSNNNDIHKDNLIPIDVVVSDNGVCSDIGRDMLERGGTAVDAAIATLLCNGVKTPHSMGIGGGCFMLIYDRYEKKTIAIDGRETAPRYMTADIYENMTEYNVNARRIGVPGELKAYHEAYLRYGRIPWRELFQPTIKMLREGFPLSEGTARALVFSQKFLQLKGVDFTYFPGVCAIFCANTTTGSLKKAGDMIYWPKLADTFKGIAEEGIDYIYNSPLTNTLVEEINNEGGIFNAADFIVDYKAKVEKPLAVQYKNYTIYSMDGATGGALVGLVLNILKGYDWEGIEKLEYFYKLLEAMKFSVADHQRLEDAAFHNVSWLLEKMRSEEYADILRSKITEQSHDASYYTNITSSMDPMDFMGTSHVSVLSNYGDAVSVTSTINWYFGSSMVSNSTGILWNNEMDDFSPLGSSKINLVEPGKRPRSSMAPVIVVDNKNDVKIVIGGAGGSYIPTSVAQVLSNLLFLDMPLEDAVDEKRVHYKIDDDVTVLERDFPKDISDKLEEDKGHKVTYYSRDIMSVIESIYVNDNIKGYADPRKLSGKASYIYRQPGE